MVVQKGAVRVTENARLLDIADGEENMDRSNLATSYHGELFDKFLCLTQTDEPIRL